MTVTDVLLGVLVAVMAVAALGVVCVLPGVLVPMPSPFTAVVLGLGTAPQLLTAPFGAYAVGRSAYRSGAPRGDGG